VKANARRCGLPTVAPHDLRRTCARLCHQAGGQLEQIQFLLGHISIQTTERYLACKQRFRDAVNDHIGLEPDCPHDRSCGKIVHAGRLVRTNPAQSSVLDYFTRARHLPGRETLGNTTLIHISSFYSSREE
jgi:hypothetical protein